MRSFDRIIVRQSCVECGKETSGEIQTKEFACFMDNYRLGDAIAQAPAGQFWLQEEWRCSGCKTSALVYVRVAEGVVVDVCPAKNFPERALPYLTVFEVIRQLRMSAEQGTLYHVALYESYQLIKNTRNSWQQDRVENPDYDTLVNKIFERIRLALGEKKES